MTARSIEGGARALVLRRGLRGCCPNCGAPLVFDNRWRLREACPAPGCGLRWQRGAGFYLGAMVVNYTAALALLLPLFIFVAHDGLGTAAATVIGLLIGVVFPILFYKPAWSLWLMVYYFVLIDELPAFSETPPKSHGRHPPAPPFARD